MCSKLTAHAAALKDFLATDPEEMVLKSGAAFSDDGKYIVVPYFAREYRVSLENGHVTPMAEPNRQVSFNDATLILHYLKHCSGLPPRGKWLSFLELPEGEHHYIPFINEACRPLAKKFGTEPALLLKQAAKLGGRELALGDAAAVIYAFPKLPLAVVLWEGDEEFPPNASIMFDSISPHHLSTASLWVLGCELSKKLIEA